MVILQIPVILVDDAPDRLLHLDPGHVTTEIMEVRSDLHSRGVELFNGLDRVVFLVKVSNRFQPRVTVDSQHLVFNSRDQTFHPVEFLRSQGFRRGE